MDDEEDIAFEYLNSEGFNSVEYEPDGNIPPDFSIQDKNIAIEVKRLNENYFAGNLIIGYYEEYYSLWELIGQFLDQYTNENI